MQQAEEQKYGRNISPKRNVVVATSSKNIVSGGAQVGGPTAAAGPPGGVIVNRDTSMRVFSNLPILNITQSHRNNNNKLVYHNQED